MRSGIINILVALGGVLFWVGFSRAVDGFFSAIKRSGRKRSPQEEGSTLEFFVVPRMRFLIRLVLGLLVGFTVLVGFALRNPGGSYYALLIPLSVFALILLASPVPVVTDHRGIRQSRWLLPDKEVQWRDIGSIARGRNTGTTYVCSRNGGPKIRFSAFLIDRNRFMHEIRAHVQNPDILDEFED